MPLTKQTSPTSPKGSPTKPVDNQDASQLQEQIALLDEQMATLRSRQAQTPERFEELQVRIEEAEQTKLRAIQQMTLLRHQAVQSSREELERPAGAQIELVNHVGREFVLKEVVDKIKDSYDYIIIVC